MSLDTLVEISVIIPVYNGAKTLCRCLDSVFEQQGINLSVYVVVQESEDESYAIAARYAEKYDNMVLMATHEGAGVSFNRNRALDAVKTGFVAFLDCDDEFFSPLSLAQLARYADEQIVICGSRIIDGSNSFLAEEAFIQNNVYKTIECLYDETLKRHTIYSTQAKLYSVKIIKKHCLAFPENLSLGEDNAFNYAYLACVKGFRLTGCPITVNHVDNVDSLSRSRRLDVVAQNIGLYQFVHERVPYAWDYYVWESVYWNCVAFFKAIKEAGLSKTKKESFYMSASLFQKLLWNPAPPRYRKMILSKRKVLLYFHLTKVFVLSL